MGSTTTQGQSVACDGANDRVAFHSGDGVGTLIADFRARYPAHLCPCLRFAEHLTAPGAKLGVEWIATPFSQGSFILCSMPDYPGAPPHFFPPRPSFRQTTAINLLALALVKDRSFVRTRGVEQRPIQFRPQPLSSSKI